MNCLLLILIISFLFTLFVLFFKIALEIQDQTHIHVYILVRQDYKFLIFRFLSELPLTNPHYIMFFLNRT
jgi:choline-glycine betaine transporter